MFKNGCHPDAILQNASKVCVTFFEEIKVVFCTLKIKFNLNKKAYHHILNITVQDHNILTK